MSHCQRFLPYFDPYLDGELPPEKMLEVEAHLDECPLCQERVRLGRALQVSLRTTVRNATVATSAFRARVQAAIAAERGRAAMDVAPTGSTWLGWRTIVPMAAAAAIVLGSAASVNQYHPQQQQQQQGSTELNATAVVENLLDEFVDNHANPPSPEVIDESLLSHLEPEVGLPVRAPRLREYGAEWEGGSLVVLGQRRSRAASLRYSLDGHEITVYVYDAARFPLRSRLEAQVVRNIPVYVGTRRGYSIATAERRGVGYAVATDLDNRESAELVASSVY